MSAFASLFSFKGRLRRADFWLLSALVFAAMVTTAGIMGELLGVDLAEPANPSAVLIQLSAIALFMWPNLAVCAKRLHDRGQSGWWIVLSFLPVIGNAWTIINLGLLRGDEGSNRYGRAPDRPQLTLFPPRPVLAPPDLA